MGAKVINAAKLGNRRREIVIMKETGFMEILRRRGWQKNLNVALGRSPKNHNITPFKEVCYVDRNANEDRFLSWCLSVDSLD